VDERRGARLVAERIVEKPELREADSSDIIQEASFDQRFGLPTGRVRSGFAAFRNGGLVVKLNIKHSGDVVGFVWENER
jgi:hypothetical protein